MRLLASALKLEITLLPNFQSQNLLLDKLKKKNTLNPVFSLVLMKSHCLKMVLIIIAT